MIGVNMYKWRPKDVVALVALVGCIGLMGLGHNHIITDVFAAIIVVYIGIDITFGRRAKDG